MATVLIVDDIEGNARLLESLLAPDGHIVQAAYDGTEALRLIRTEPPDLVLMDVMMPHVDGFEACRAIKGVERFSRTRPEMKVLYMSGYTGDTILRHGILDAQTPS